MDLPTGLPKFPHVTDKKRKCNVKNKRLGLTCRNVIGRTLMSLRHHRIFICVVYAIIEEEEEGVG